MCSLVWDNTRETVAMLNKLDSIESIETRIRHKTPRTPHLHQGLLRELRGLEGHGPAHIGGDGVGRAVAWAGGPLQAVHAGAGVGVEAREGARRTDGAGGACGTTRPRRVYQLYTYLH